MSGTHVLSSSSSSDIVQDPTRVSRTVCVWLNVYGTHVLCLGRMSYVWDACPMSGTHVLCLGRMSYVWDACPMSGTHVLVYHSCPDDWLAQFSLLCAQRWPKNGLRHHQLFKVTVAYIFLMLY